MDDAKMLEVARQAAATAQKLGAQQVAANAYRSREVEVQWRDGRLEKLFEADATLLPAGAPEPKKAAAP